MEQGSGIEGHWNLTDLIGSTANSFDSVAADVDQDGQWEIVVSKNAMCQFYCLEQDGTVRWSTPLLSTHTPGYYGGEVVDLETDGRPEIVAVADSIWVLDAASGMEKWRVPDVGAVPDETPWTVGHVSSPDRWNIVIARTRDTNFVVSTYDWTGNLIWTTTIEDATYGHTISVKDVDADGLDEVFVACSKKTVALDHDGREMWRAPLIVARKAMAPELLQQHDLRVLSTMDLVSGWWYHSDFVEIADLSGDGQYEVLHDYGGGAGSPTTLQVLDALSGLVVGSFASTGHVQWLKTAELDRQSPGLEIVYVTREKVVVRGSDLSILWERELSGAHELGIGDWNGDGNTDVIVSTIFRGYESFAALDSNLVVYDGLGQVLYNMRYAYPGDAGRYAGAQMQNAMKRVVDVDGDGRVEFPVCFSNHDDGKFASSQDVHQYLMGMTSTHYSNLFHDWANDSQASAEHTDLTRGTLRLGHVAPDRAPRPTKDTVLLIHMDEGTGTLLQDSSDYKNDGLLLNGDWVTDGKFGASVRFDSPGEAGVVPFSPSLDLRSVAIEAWLQASDVTAPRYVVEKPGSFGLLITHEGKLSFYILDSTALRGKRAHVETPFPGGEEFAHVIATYDGLWLRLSVNGLEKAVDSHAGAIDDNDNALIIGNSASLNMQLRGTVDELRISATSWPTPYATVGDWTSTPIFPPGGDLHYGTIELTGSENGGSISYDLLDEEYQPIPGHLGITISPHDLGDIVEPFCLRVHLAADPDTGLSPQVRQVVVTKSDLAVSPGQIYTARAGSPFCFTHTVTHTYPGQELLYLSVSAPDEWAPRVEPSWTVLHSQAAIPVTVTVQVPHLAQNDRMVVSLTATSGLGSLPVTVTDTLLILFSTYLPLVTRSDHGQR